MILSLPGPFRTLLLAVLLFSFSYSFGCKCAGQSSVKVAYDGSAIVVTGMVLKVEYFGLVETMVPDSIKTARSLPQGENSNNYLDTPMVLKATIVVTMPFKGLKKNDTIVVYTGIRGATCGFKFEKNKEYTIYATTQNYMYMFLRVDRQRFRNFTRKDVYWTSICSRTTDIVGQEQLLLEEMINGTVKK